MSKAAPWTNLEIGTVVWAKAKLVDPSMEGSEKDYVYRIIAIADGKKMAEVVNSHVERLHGGGNKKV